MSFLCQPPMNTAHDLLARYLYKIPIVMSTDAMHGSRSSLVWHHTRPRAPLQQGVYKFNWTNFQKIPGGISRKIQDMFALLRHATQCTESTSLPKYRTKTWHAQHGAVAKIKKGRPISLISNPVRSFMMTVETNAVDHRHVAQKFPEGPYKFKEISRRVFKFQ